MTKRINTICNKVTSNPRLFPTRVSEAASRLSTAFGAKRIGSISARDLDRYLTRAAGSSPAPDAWCLGGVAEEACYDLHMLATMALSHGDSTCAERVKEWMVPHLLSIASNRQA